MRCVLSYPGVMAHAQQAALALAEAGELDRFVTSFGYREDGALAGLVRALPGGLSGKLKRELGRRRIMPDLAGRTTVHGGWEVLRTLFAKSGAGPIWTDRAWDMAAHRFDEMTADLYVPGCEAIVAFEYTARASFERARDLGRARVLHLPSLDSRAYKAIEDREREEWPELRGPHDAYFESRFEERYARRCAEVALADVIIANSSLTKASHVAAGADPDKVFVAPLGAPAPIADIRSTGGPEQPLAVLWSGPFSLRKGAHYLLDAWRLLAPGKTAELKVYGEISAPERLMATTPDDIVFMGSVPQDVMLDAFQAADVLVFPTLSDGFGMAITEALSRGVPVIATDQAGAADLIKPGVNGLIIPAGDAKALRDALAWCQDNRKALTDMRPAALETARQHQWSHYRRDVMAATHQGLSQTGYGTR